MILSEWCDNGAKITASIVETETIELHTHIDFCEIFVACSM